MTQNRMTVLAVGGAFALGAIGSNALGDDSESWEELRAVQTAQADDSGDDEPRDDRENDDQHRIDGARDDDVVDVEPRDEDDDRDSGGGDTNSGGTDDGAKDNTGTGTNRPTGGD